MNSSDDDADADADGVITNLSTQNVCNRSHLKTRHVIMVTLPLYDQQIIVQLWIISGLGPVVLPKKNKKESVATTKVINL
jgi:hypothetical protein